MADVARVYTAEQHRWIAEHYADMTNHELAAAYNERFGTDAMTLAKLNAYGANHRLHKSADTLARRNVKYTHEQRAWLREYIPGHHEGEIIDAYERRFGERLTVSMVANLKVKLGVRSGTVGNRFPKGNVPMNKGKTWDEMGISPESQAKMRETTFQKGCLSGVAADRKRPLLDVRREPKNGYLQIKVAPRNIQHFMQNWIPLSEFVWMQHHGRDFPEGHRAVFADHDNRNFDPENIVAVPMDLYAIITGGVHGKAIPYHDRATLDVAITHARLMRERRRLELQPRTCGVCGRTFEPTYPHARTCRECLDAGKRLYGGKVRKHGMKGAT